jgi:thiol-disulfide isomerase/thioredoxin
MRDNLVMKSTFLLLTAAVLTSTASANDSGHRSRCDESGCHIGEHGRRNSGPRMSANDRYQGDYSSFWRGRDCADGECCPNGQCRLESGKRSYNGADDRDQNEYGPEAAHRHDFLYRSEVADSRDRRLANPFRPVGHESEFSRNDRAPIPTGFESQRPVSRRVSWQSDLQRAVDDAKRAGLPLLIQVSAEWCPHCVRMTRETYTDPQLTNIISQRYVAVSVDADEQREFIQQMGIQSLPTTLVVAPDLRILNRLQGFQSADQIMQALSR